MQPHGYEGLLYTYTSYDIQGEVQETRPREVAIAVQVGEFLFLYQIFHQDMYLFIFKSVTIWPSQGLRTYPRPLKLLGSASKEPLDS